MTKKPKTKQKRIVKRIYLGRDENGKPKYKKVSSKTEMDAAEKALLMKIKLRKGINVSADRDTFETWAKRWLATKERKLSLARYKKYKHCIEKQLESLRLAPISKICAYDVQDIINDLARENPNTGKPSSEKTLKDIVSVVWQVFNMAIKNSVVEFNPSAAVDIPAEPSEQVRRALTDEEQQWIVNTPHRARIAAMILMYAGLRRGELIPLTWKDINLDEKVIDINKSVIMVNGKAVVQPGKAKTVGSIRTVDIPQVLADFLKSEKPKDAEPDDLICVSAKGKMISDSGWKRMWDSYLADLNIKYGNLPKEFKSKHNPHGVPFLIPRLTAHWLRHTFITMMYLAGVDVLTAMQQAGHADIKTTLSIYTHLDKKFKRTKMNLMDEYIKNQTINYSFS